MSDLNSSGILPHEPPSLEDIQVAEEFRNKVPEKMQDAILELIESCKE
jgi:hypothetical protein